MEQYKINLSDTYVSFSSLEKYFKDIMDKEQLNALLLDIYHKVDNIYIAEEDLENLDNEDDLK